MCMFCCAASLGLVAETLQMQFCFLPCMSVSGLSVQEHSHDVGVQKLATLVCQSIFVLLLDTKLFVYTNLTVQL